jgi:NAD+ synthase
MNKRIELMIKDMRDFSDRTGLKKAVIGISGGKDSTIVAKLAIDALGKDNVLGVTMPKDKSDICESQYQIANWMGLRLLRVPIDDPFHAIASDVQRPLYDKGVYPNSADLRMAGINLQPRLRMATLYYVGRLTNSFVLNTSNFDERLVGYSTIWGDDVGDYGPLNYLHVSEVKQLGYDLGIPAEFVDIPPSDGLSGKTDEEAMGFTYAEVEELSKKFAEEYKDPDMDNDTGFVDEEEWPEEVRIKGTNEIKKLEGHELAIVKMHNKNLFKYNSIMIACYSPYLETI